MYLTPPQIADLIKQRCDDTHAQIADHLGVDRSAVSHALSDPSPRRIKLLSRIAGLYGIDVDHNEPAYKVDEESMKHKQGGT